ncbi:MAG: hypothetical protein RL204_1264 [Bacteroidota bacterium]|jgi:hypothetical protein
MELLEANKIIKISNVRVLLDELINFPSIDRKRITPLEIDSEESSLFGYAFEVLFDFYMQRNESFEVISSRYSKPLNRFVSQCEKKQGTKKEELFLFYNQNVFVWNATNNRELAIEYSNGYKTLRLADVQNKYIESLEIISNNIGLPEPSDELYDALSEVAKVYPSLKKFTISIRHLGQPNDSLRLGLRIAFLELKQKFPKSPRLVIREPRINFCNIYCRPDFIIDNALVEIKCTKELLVKEHVRQIVFYYIALTRQKVIKASKITKILIYYPRYDFVYEEEISNLINLENFDSSTEELEGILEGL